MSDSPSSLVGSRVTQSHRASTPSREQDVSLCFHAFVPSISRIFNELLNKVYPNALQQDHRAHIEAEDAGETVDDEDVELEEEFLGEGDRFSPALPPSLHVPPHTAKSLSPLSKPFASSNLSPPLSKTQKENLAKRVQERAKRAQAAQQRKATNNLKPRAVRHAQGAQPSLVTFDTSSLPISSTGWTGFLWRNLAVLTSTNGLKLLAWDGKTCIVLVDRSDCIIAVLGGVPPGSQGAEWQALVRRLNVAIRKCSEQSTFTTKETCHPWGTFTARATGIAYGRGRQVPGKIAGIANLEEMRKLMDDVDLQRVAGLSNSLFNAFGHKTFTKYKDTLSKYLAHDSRLHPTSPHTVFAATTVNFGPQTCTPPHLDAGNTAHGWCTDTAAGTMILFPSVLIMHSNIPISPHKTHYSLIQYSAGDFSAGGTTAGVPTKPGLPGLPGRRKRNGNRIKHTDGS
ncbi:hypothetical protein BDP27DRAFT_1422541 [Rhodocollybia butyracea]|uniref:Uncharacterized protein n=1 Tax=Rhodocollybia butyracea TaxID=206335 RepID=A0A9P5PPV0_9AGAR|nr:hypothetical protein BDP27DRAFT_1422541 [Rhodocollybia butyracea]